MHRTLPFLLSLAACATPVATVPFTPPAPAAVDLDAPGPIVHEAVVSATWAVPTSGLIDLSDRAAAGLEDGPHPPIVLPVHVLNHPTRGTWIVDTGVPEAPWTTGPLLGVFAAEITPVEPLALLLARQPTLAGVLLTHNHLDHVLGLPDVPAGVPIHVGAGDEAPTTFTNRVMFRAFRAGLDGRAVSTFDFDGPDVLDLEGVSAIDVLGDGSLYALDAHGHTPGSTAYLARTTEGPVLFTGDCSHTRWGWAHGVTPGTYTEDHDANAHSLDALRALAARHPGMRVEVGHELAD